MDKLIETALPLAEIRGAAVRERTGRPGHPANLHMWWGRSPEASSLAALAAAAMPFSQETAAADMALLAKAAAGGRDALAAVRGRLRQCGPPPVWDPFAGAGSIPLAAQKLGLETAANDLNPVAALLTGAAADIPARFASRRPVHPGAALRSAYSGAEGLAEDVRFYGAWMERQARKRLAGAYPQTADGETPFAWLWVRTVKCPNPACGCRIPLGSSYVLHRAGTSGAWAEPEAAADRVRFAIREGVCPAGRTSNKVGRGGARFRCLVCGEVTTDEYVKKTGLAHQLGAEMMAVVTDAAGKRAFFPPDAAQMTAAAVQTPAEAPPGAMPANAHWFSPPGFGITEYAGLFTPRQTLLLCTFSDLARQAQDLAASAAAGMPGTGGALEAGGTGALAYGQAVGVYLALAVDKMADYSSAVCSWRTADANIRSTFGRQAIPMVWTFAEGNPFSGVSGNFKAMLHSVAESLERLGGGAPAAVSQDDAVTMAHPQDVLVCTELPYYRDIGYADLSDFFYIWLRRSLQNAYPRMLAPMTAPKDELTTASAYCGTARETAEETYRAGLLAVCGKLYACCAADWPALLFYCFRRDDLACIRHGRAGRNGSAWEFMLESLLSAGFAVTAVWPMRSAPAAEAADSARVLIVARKGTDRQAQTTRRGFIRALRRELPERLRLLLSGHVPPEDEFLSCMGQGLRIFSQYRRVLNADGSAMCAHDALQIICPACADAIAQREHSAPADGAAAREE